MAGACRNLRNSVNDRRRTTSGAGAGEKTKDNTREKSTMPFANYMPIPASIQLNIATSKQQTNYAIPQQLLLAPTNFGGGIFDCTGATTVNLWSDNGIDGAGWVGIYESIPDFTGNTNGLAVTFDTSLLQEIVTGGNGGGRLRIVANDGVNTVDIATGNWSQSETA